MQYNILIVLRVSSRSLLSISASISRSLFRRPSPRNTQEGLAQVTAPQQQQQASLQAGGGSPSTMTDDNTFPPVWLIHVGGLGGAARYRPHGFMAAIAADMEGRKKERDFWLAAKLQVAEQVSCVSMGVYR